jgi:hypothetical protein
MCLVITKSNENERGKIAFRSIIFLQIYGKHRRDQTAVIVFYVMVLNECNFVFTLIQKLSPNVNIFAHIQLLSKIL